jgi:hypothetical protein
MCLRIKVGNHQRVRTTKLLKSLYLIVQYVHSHTKFNGKGGNNVNKVKINGPVKNSKNLFSPLDTFNRVQCSLQITL